MPEGININFAWPEHRLAVQLDYPDFDDRRRHRNAIEDAQLVADGWRVIRVDSELIDEEPELFVDWLAGEFTGPRQPELVLVHRRMLTPDKV